MKKISLLFLIFVYNNIYSQLIIPTPSVKQNVTVNFDFLNKSNIYNVGGYNFHVDSMSESAMNAISPVKNGRIVRNITRNSLCVYSNGWKCFQTENEITLSDSAPNPINTFITKLVIDTVGIDTLWTWNNTSYKRFEVGGNSIDSAITLSNVAPAPLTTFRTKEWIDTTGIDEKRYVWNGISYILNPTDWHTTGNYGTTPTSNFLGTIDSQDLAIRTNNIEKIRLYRAVNSNNQIYSLIGGDALINSITVGRGNGNIIYNTSIGYGSLYYNTTGLNNTSSGYWSLFSNTTGSDNTSSGYYSLKNNLIGSRNTSSGVYSLSYNTIGNNNTSTGYASLYYNTSGSDNTSSGVNSLLSNTTGYSNTSTGYASLYSNISGFFNTSSGVNSLLSNKTGSRNTSSGVESLKYNTSGVGNVSNGFQSLSLNTIGNYNVSNGFKSLYNNTIGIGNTSSGTISLSSLTNGNYNTSTGYSSLENLGSNISPTSIIIGKSYKIIALGTQDFTLIGASANTAGVIFTATAIGTGTGTVQPDDIFNNNVSIGYRSGYQLRYGSNNTFIGSNINPTEDLSNNVIISDGTGAQRINVDPIGRTGINTGLNPNSTLQVNGNIAIRDTTVTTANYTMSAGNDPTNVCFKVGASGTINLTAGQVRSREYHLINYSGVSLTFGTAVRTATGATTLILPADEKYIIYWSGTEWIRKN